MPDDRTTVTELVTGLGTLGHGDVGAALVARSPAMVSVSPELWGRLDALHAGGAVADSFHAAFLNGRAFLSAAEGLRGRPPLTVEWRGGARPVDDDLVPADLRIDHVFLVSCKYLSQVVANAAPARLFDGLLRLRAPAERVGWFEVVAPAEYRTLVAAACAHAGVPVPAGDATVSAADRPALSAPSPAASRGSPGRPLSPTSSPDGSRTSPATSRSAGATAASTAPPRPRSTSTPPT